MTSPSDRAWADVMDRIEAICPDAALITEEPDGYLVAEWDHRRAAEGRRARGLESEGHALGLAFRWLHERGTRCR